MNLMGLRPSQNRLTYPAGRAPGVDYAHPASTQLICSTIAIGGDTANGGGVHYNIPSAKLSTATGGGSQFPTSVLSGIIGPASNIPYVASNDQWLQLTIPVVTISNATWAAIVAITQTFNNNGSFGIFDDATNLSFRFQTTGTAGVLSTDNTWGLNQSNIAPNTAGAPCFVAASTNPTGVVNFVMTRLDTGQSFSNVHSGSTHTTYTTSGSVRIGDRNGTQVPLQGLLAASMWSGAYLTMGQLLQWANDPWSFWYPQAKISPGLHLATAGGVKVMQLPLTGVGYRKPGKLLLPDVAIRRPARRRVILPS